MRNFLSCAIKIIKVGFASDIIYRSNIIGKVISSIVVLFAHVSIWYGLYNSNKYIDIVVYLVLETIFLNFFCLEAGELISVEYCSSEIIGKMILPVDYRIYIICFILGRNVSNLFFYVTPMFLSCAIIYGFVTPSSFFILFVSFLSMVLGGMIYTLINMILSYLSFWLKSNWYIKFFQSALFTLFGGKNLPMWFFPVILTEISQFTPFYYSTYVPIALYLGKIPLQNTIWILLTQCFWILLLKFFESIIWKISLKRVASWGG